ncbi:deoxyuridine 5'-triphosphate nucleotidohydrolase [Eupransor demetentiae]|uniref:dUTP diphosphatase n=1 Tax=Eupransor demetentiae TaxID=3109584 RepID=A0ABM9N6P9_9LACO|nr:dUTP pyrophosphatase (dUTPase) (Dut) [Lactobacillaceae bacterium LMG 33000]
MAVRGFEVVSKYQEAGLTVPERSTHNAAGYDFKAAQDMVLPSLVNQPFLKELNIFSLGKISALLEKPEVRAALKPTLIPTGIKAYMQPGEFLQLVARSSAPIKKQIMMPNGVGIVDADYYNNEGNEGEIFFQYLNFGLEDVHIKKGERIGQGVFMPYLLADQDEASEKTTRVGGFGSTGEA